jgi:hypothetical protein
MLDEARANDDARYECRALNALGDPFLTVQTHRFEEWQPSEDSSEPALDQEHLEKIGTRAKRALQLAERIADPALKAEAMVNLGLWHSQLGEPDMANFSSQPSLLPGRPVNTRPC